MSRSQDPSPPPPRPAATPTEDPSLAKLGVDLLPLVRRVAAVRAHRLRHGRGRLRQAADRATLLRALLAETQWPPAR